VAQRESVRRGVLRANRAVTAILVVVFLLGLAMLAVSYRAHQSQRRAEQAEAEATERLWNSYLAQARAERLNPQAGHRAAALTAVSNAALIRPSVELRSEAMSALGLRDLEREVAWPLRTGAYGFHFDPDLQFYVVSYASAELSMFRLADNAHVRTFRAADAGLGTNVSVREFFFSASGRYLVMQYSTGAIVFWEKDTGRVAHTFGTSGDELLAWHPTFTSDDRTMLALSRQRRGVALVIDLASGTRRELFITNMNWTVAMSRRGDLFSWYRGRDVFLHDVASGALRNTVSFTAEVMSLWWDWKGEQFSVWCRDSTVHLVNVRTGRTRQLGGKVPGPWMQQFSPDGTLLSTSGHDGTSRLWDLGEARLLAQTTEGRAFVFGSDGTRIAYGVPGREVGVWRISTPTGYRLWEGVVTDAATVWHQDLSEEGKWFAWATPWWIEPRGFEVFDLRNQRRLPFMATSQHVRVAFHPIERKLFVADGRTLDGYDLPRTPTDALKRSGSIPMPDGLFPSAFAFSDDGKRALVATTSSNLVVLNLESPGQYVALEGRLRHLSLPASASRTGSGALALSPDGRWAVVGSATRDGGIAVWNTSTGRIVARLSNTASHVAFSGDGQWLVGISAGAYTLWNVDGWREQWQRPRVAVLNTPGAAAFSPESDVVAFTPRVDQIEFVETKTGERVATLGNPKLVSIAGLRFSTDARRLVATASDGVTHVWDMKEIRGELAKLRLDHPFPPATPPPASLLANATPTVLGGLGLGAVGLAVSLGLVVLRRHGRLTEQFVRTAELASQQARELAAERELNELKSRFVSMVSHEFRTPLGITMSAVELLRNYADRLPPDKLKELLGDIYSSTLRMSGLMEQVLLLGRVEAGKMNFQRAPLDLAGLGDKLVDETLSATNRRCPVFFRADKDLDGAQGDESLLRHILSNLLSNAVKYSPDGGSVDFTIHRGSNHAVFTVRDHGIGIPEADRARLFEAFHRASNVGQTPGTGLGLLIVKRCVDLHQGTIRFESAEGRGTTFVVRLPLFGQEP
jgi:signal transduction histidine kinase